MTDLVLVFEGQGARSVPADPAAPAGPALDLTTMAPAEAQRTIVAHQVARARACLAGRPVRFAVLGQSLGELAALVVAGAVGLADALELARARAELPAATLAPRPWTMASFTRLPVTRAEAATTGLAAWVAARNAPSDCVVVAAAGDFEAFVERVGADPNTYRHLPVVHPYHTPAMAPVTAALAEVLERMAVRPPAVQVVSPTGPREVRRADDVRDVLLGALTAPVAWADALALAAGRWPDARWRECGPSCSLHRFVWKNRLSLDWKDA